MLRPSLPSLGICICRIPSKFRHIERVGKGTYGECWKALNLADNQTIMSLKEMKLSDTETVIPGSCLRELTILCELDHINVVHPLQSHILYDPLEHILAFAYEYGSFDVRRLINFFANKNQTLHPCLVKSVMFQLLLALEYIHARNIAHCDITPPNLLIMPPTNQPPGILKLIDFNLARVIDGSDQPRNYGVVTIWYRAPELLLGDTQYNQEVDIWAAGCIFAELLTGKVLFATAQTPVEQNPTNFNSAQVSRIVELLGPMTQDDFPHFNTSHHRAQLQKMRMAPKTRSLGQIVQCQSQAALDLLSKMLAYDPRKRVTAKDALTHEYFREAPGFAMNISRYIIKEDWAKLCQNEDRQ